MRSNSRQLPLWECRLKSHSPLRSLALLLPILLLSFLLLPPLIPAASPPIIDELPRAMIPPVPLQVNQKASLNDMDEGAQLVKAINVLSSHNLLRGEGAIQPTTTHNPNKSAPSSPSPSNPHQKPDRLDVPHTDKFWPSLLAAFLMILVSELGDKTFLIAAIMAMRHSRALTFTSAMLALTIMTVISTAFGILLPSLIPRAYTRWLVAMLFLLFGIKMIIEGLRMTQARMREEYDEISHEIEETEDLARRRDLSSSTLNAPSGGTTNGTLSNGLCLSQALEAGTLRSGDYYSTEHSNCNSHPLFHRYLRRLLSCLAAIRLIKIVSPVCIQTFSLTFLAEWGDRSQIATIALAAAENVYGVTIGAILGHSLCTLLAVVAGRLLSTILSVRTVTISGGLLFIAFSILAFL